MTATLIHVDLLMNTATCPVGVDELQYNCVDGIQEWSFYRPKLCRKDSRLRLWNVIKQSTWYKNNLFQSKT